jgi:flagellar assembly protein FliH
MTSSPSVIKALERGGLRRPHRSILVESLFEAEILEPPPLTPEEIVERTLSDARDLAGRLVSEAHMEAEGIRETARQAGYADGEREAETEWSQRVAELDEQAAAMQRDQEAFYTSAEPELAKLSVDIARKVLKQEISQNPEAVLKVVRAAIHRVKDKEVRALVNPEDLETVRGERDTLLGIADGVSAIEIVSDRRVGRGGCVLETPSGSVDARIETQLEHISEMMDKESHDEPEAENA